MNYEEKSDFEINKAVHFKMIDAGKVKERCRLNDVDFVDVFRNEFGENPGPSVIAVMRYVKDGISDGYNPFGGAFDYCNNPSDAWPIIMENFISIDQHHNGSYIRVWGYCDAGLISMQCLRKYALRTAMIIFLKMQEAKRG